MSLTDEQCNEFRRMRGSFNDMIRATHEAGSLEGKEEALTAVFQINGPSRAITRLREKYGINHRQTV